MSPLPQPLLMGIFNREISIMYTSYPYILLLVSYSCSCTSMCMLELKFAIYHRAASLSSQASSVYVCSIGWSWRILISNSAILHNNYISLLSGLCACVHVKKNGIAIEKEAIVLQWVVQTSSWDFKPGKKRWAGALLSGKCCCFVQNQSWKSHADLN